jgi:hypothetical protein
MGSSLCSTGVGGQGSATTLFLDTFTDINQGLGAHAPDTDVVGNGWTIVNGSWAINSDKCQVSSAGPAPGSIAETNLTGYSDVTVQCDLQFSSSPGGNDSGVIIRGDGTTSNFWLASVENTLFSILERSGGSWFSRASTSISALGTSVHTIKLQGSGASLTATLDGSNTLSYTSSDLQTNTRCGIYTQQPAGSNPTFDNFKVTKP